MSAINLFVIIPCRNEARGIGPFANALADQCAALGHTLVLVDNASTDGTLEILRAVAARHSRNCYVQEEARLGPGHPRRSAASVALERTRRPAETWLAFVDADCVAPDDYVARVQDAIHSTNARALSGRVRWDWPADAPAWLPPAVTDAAAVIPISERLVGIVNLAGCNHAVRGDLYEEIGGHTQFVHPATGLLDAGDDWDLGLRIWGQEPIGSLDVTMATSTRRIRSNPVGFLTAQAYEDGITEIRDESGSADRAEPAALSSLVARKQRYYLKHFLLKPLLYRRRRVDQNVLMDLLGEHSDEFSRFAETLQPVDLRTARAPFVHGALADADDRWGGFLFDRFRARFL